MKFRTPLALILALFAIVTALIPQKAAADEDSVSFEFFYENLEPHGEWVEIDDYGYCWRPTDVDEEWSPYSDGYWTYTDAGWTWVSYEDFGWITYHYGRWVRVDDYGWCWVPDYEWGPAWVSWRSSDDYIGWAPLPPEVSFRREVGISIWVDAEYDIGPTYYNFCEYRHFGSPALRPVIVDRSQNVTIINKTVNITNITYNNSSTVVYNGGPRYNVVAQRTERPIETLKLVRRQNAREARLAAREKRALARQEGNQLIVAAPRVERAAEKPRPNRLARRISRAQVDKGWRHVKDPQVKEQLRSKIKAEAQSAPNKAPAQPVAEADLQVVPKKADPNARPNRPNRRDKVTAGTDDTNARAQDQNSRRANRGNPKHAEPRPNATDSTTDPAAATAGGAERPRKAKNGENLQPFVPGNGTAEAQEQRKQEQEQLRQQRLAEQEKLRQQRQERAAERQQAQAAKDGENQQAVEDAARLRKQQAEQRAQEAQERRLQQQQLREQRQQQRPEAAGEAEELRQQRIQERQQRAAEAQKQQANDAQQQRAAEAARQRQIEGQQAAQERRQQQEQLRQQRAAEAQRQQANEAQQQRAAEAARQRQLEAQQAAQERREQQEQLRQQRAQERQNEALAQQRQQAQAERQRAAQERAAEARELRQQQQAQRQQAQAQRQAERQQPQQQNKKKKKEDE